MSEIKNIIICSPGNVLVSGGVNSLHNLCRALMNCGYNAYMYYMDADEAIVNHEYYTVYQTKRLMEIEDSSENLFICSETMTPFLLQFKEAHKMVYWLGLTLFFKTPTWRFPFNVKLFRKLVECRSYAGYSSGRIEDLKRKLYHYAKSHLKLWDGDVMHLANSFFVAEYCKTKGVNAHALHNPIRDEFYNQAGGEKVREDLILLGPKTKRKYLRGIQRRLPNYKVVKLKKLPSDKVVELMSKAKLFVEFGNFSGRDRMPREAAMLGCVVLINTRGTASSNKDYDLPSNYKLVEEESGTADVLDLMCSCVQEYRQHFSDQDGFRRQLKREKDMFLENASSVFSFVRESR